MKITLISGEFKIDFKKVIYEEIGYIAVLK